MAGTTLWKGIIIFGDFHIGVKLRTTVREDRIALHLLHRNDLVRLRQQMLCAYEKKTVPPEEQIKGFEIEPGKYLLIEAEELEQTAPEKSRWIEVHEFVPQQAIDFLFFDRFYVLEPDTLAEGYRELVEVLLESKVAGLCTWSMRKRSYFGVLVAHGSLLRLITLHYADEVVPVATLELPEIPVTEKELRIGRELIRQLSGPFAPEQFVNEHQHKLQQLIERKARGEQVALVLPKELRPTDADQLLKALEASLKKAA